MFRAQYLTEWVDMGHRREMYPATLGLPISISDVTGQPDAVIPTDPNVVVVEVEGDAASLNALAADAHCSELWRKEIINAIT